VDFESVEIRANPWLLFALESVAALLRFPPVRCLSLVLLCVIAVAQSDRIPPEVRYKSGYVNSVPKPVDFTSAMLWGIAIADTRVVGYERAQVEIRTRS